jgi:hypothetical protein
MGRNQRATKGQVVIPSKPQEPPKPIGPPSPPKVAGEFSKWALEKGIVKKEAGAWGTAAKVMGGVALGAGGLAAVSHAADIKKKVKAEKPFLKYMKKTPVKQMLGTGSRGMGAAMQKYRRAAFE